jgi:hypothetical protein
MGSFLNGKKHGYGYENDYETGIEYRGNFINDIKEG